MTQGHAAPPSLPTIDADATPTLLDDEGVREALERDALPAFLARQRWFAGKARRIERVRIADWGLVPAVSPPLILMTIAVTDAQATEHYFVPLTLVSGVDTRTPATATSIVTRLRSGDAVLADAIVDDDVCVALGEMLSRPDEVPLATGEATPRFPANQPPAPGALRPVVRGKSEQSNTTVFLARRLALKIIRKLDDGPNPDVEIGLFLAEVGFTHVPRLAAALVYHPRSGPAATIAMLQDFVQNDGNGWEQAQDEVRRYFDAVDRRVADHVEAPPAASDPLGRGEVSRALSDLIPYLQDVATLGRRTAELHLALSRGTDDAFAPEPATSADIKTLAEGMRAHGRTALDLLDAHRDRIPAAARQLADTVLDASDALLAQFDRLADAPVHADRIRVHGDYHLGQVLRTGHDFVIVDFEGEPMRSLAERRRKHFALKDVAGLLRSFDYAIFGGVQDRYGASSEALARIEPWARAWQSWTSARFVRSYRDTAGRAAFLPASADAVAIALEAFLLDRALYELVYELNNRPTWVTVPLYGLRRFTLSSPDESP